MTARAGRPHTIPSSSHRQAVGATSSRPDGRAASPFRSRIERLRGGIGREVVTFVAIGIVSTAAYAVLYLALRTAVGAVAANALALLITAVGNTAANRRLTFGVRGRESMIRDQVAGLIAFAIALAITTASVNLLGALAPHAGRLVELSVLVVANALATVSRFVLLRGWIARGPGAAVPAVPAAPGAQNRSSS